MAVGLLVSTKAVLADRLSRRQRINHFVTSVMFDIFFSSDGCQRNKDWPQLGQTTFPVALSGYFVCSLLLLQRNHCGASFGQFFSGVNQWFFTAVSLVTSATYTPSSFALPFAYLTGCCLHTQESDAMEKTLQEQIKRVQTLTDNQKEKFLRIYFHGCQHLFVDSAVRTADPE